MAEAHDDRVEFGHDVDHLALVAAREVRAVAVTGHPPLPRVVEPTLGVTTEWDLGRRAPVARDELTLLPLAAAQVQEAELGEVEGPGVEIARGREHAGRIEGG